MLDIRFIRDNAVKVQDAATNKGYQVDIEHLLKIDSSRRELISQIDELRAKRNDLAAGMKQAKPTAEQIEEGKKYKTELAEIEDKFKSVDQEFLNSLKKVPNMPLADVPVGLSEDENVVIKTVGEPTKFDFEPKNHWQIAQARGWIDKQRAAKVAGSRFAYIKGDLVRLQFAIVQFAIDTLGNPDTIKKIIANNNLKVSDKPFTPILPPLMIRTELYDAMDRLEPRDDRYKIEDEELWLQGSAEHVLGSMFADEIFPEDELPIRYLGYATSFRREAGTYGKDMEGMFRMHQFDKLELESFVTSDQGEEEHKFMVAVQEYLMQQLKIPYQLLKKCTFDIGKPNAAGVDIEAWMPGQNKYRETHTADYMTDYQARRLQTRVRRNSGEVELVHTNDATCFALSRTPIAIIENYQNADNTVGVPEVLQPYLGNKTVL